MKMIDVINCPLWVLGILCVVFAVIGIVMLMGSGENLIAGYASSSEAEKAKYDVVKLRRVVGTGVLVLALIQLVMLIGAKMFPAFMSYVFLGLHVADCLVMLVLINKDRKNEKHISH